MKVRLCIFSLVVLAALIGVSIWATNQVSVVPAINDLLSNPASGFNPWFVATLFDAYFGFLWFWLWIAYKESSWLARIVWLILILLLGNMAMAAYMLLTLARLQDNAQMEDLLLRRKA
jgi:drug/metabolite transporter (DMT)-like permease